MTPQEAAAHHIARHLRAIATHLTNASEDVWRVYCPGAENIKVEYLAMLVRKAEDIEATAPFEPLTDVERTLVSGWIGDELGDMSYRELIRQYTGDFTEADWRMEYEDHNEYMNDAHDEA